VHTPIYQAENDKLTVSLFFKTSPTAKPDPNLQAIMDARSSNSTLVTFDLSRYLSINSNYNFWTYLGSPTMPYCTDNTVNWIVLEKPYEITQEQGDFFSKMFYQEFQTDGNWRAAQRNVNTLGFYDFMSQ
jgi:carbonic anhydrase